MTSCNLNYYGDIELGADFYYLVEPAFNSIVTPTNKEKPFKSGNYIIREVEALGFNQDLILVISSDNDSLKYWLINKTKEAKDLGIDKKSNLRLSNVNQIDSLKFTSIRKEKDILMKTKSEYRKELRYE